MKRSERQEESVERDLSHGSVLQATKQRLWDVFRPELHTTVSSGPNLFLPQLLPPLLAPALAPTASWGLLIMSFLNFMDEILV